MAGIRGSSLPLALGVSAEDSFVIAVVSTTTGFITERLPVTSFVLENYNNTGVNAPPSRPAFVVGPYAPTLPSPNVDIILNLPGTGALSIDLPDGGIDGGNKRGEAAIDFQNERTAADQVAGGNRSVISGGRRNSISPTAVVATIGGGQDNVASGNVAVVGGGATNVASGNRTTVGGGANNTASGAFATVAGGVNNIADGERSVIAGGARGTTRGTSGRFTYSAGGFTDAAADTGTAQYSLVVMRRQTTDATAGPLTTNGGGGAVSTNIPALPDNSVCAFRGHITCRQTAGTAGAVGDAKVWEVVGAVKRGAGVATAALVGTPTITVIGADANLGADNSTGAVISVAANTSDGTVRIAVTGQANKTLRWVGTLHMTEVAAAV